MTLKKALRDAVKVILEEVERNPEFAERLEAALGLARPRKAVRRKASGDGTRRGNRRAPAVFDPVALAREGEDVLRARLGELSVEQLKDIVADYGMDAAKLVMKWKSPDRIIDRIVDVSIGRAKKGDAFL